MKDKEKDRDKEREKDIRHKADEFLKGLYAKGILKKFEELETQIEFVPTGILSLDIALGGGLVKGVIVDLFGLYGSGKSTICYRISSIFQKLGKTVIFADAERSGYRARDWMIKIGCDPKKISFLYCDTAEEYLDTIFDIFDNSAADLVIVDSVPGLVPKIVMERDLAEDQRIGALAQVMSRALSKLVQVVDKSKGILIFVNQIREVIDTMGRVPISLDEKATGGKGLKFYASLRLGTTVVPGSQIKIKDEVVGHRIRIKVFKSKFAPPFKTCEFDIRFDHGVVIESELFDLLQHYGVIQQDGGWFTLMNKKFQGKEKVLAYLLKPESVSEAFDILSSYISNVDLDFYKRLYTENAKKD